MNCQIKHQNGLKNYFSVKKIKSTAIKILIKKFVANMKYQTLRSFDDKKNKNDVTINKFAIELNPKKNVDTFFAQSHRKIINFLSISKTKEKLP